ncbi:hypothetical protein J6590_024158 [Homalodisca vitripennis]|nr:hypothetical protein J6590_024158 [Homalodisca vitripennis]
MLADVGFLGENPIYTECTATQVGKPVLGRLVGRLRHGSFWVVASARGRREINWTLQGSPDVQACKPVKYFSDANLPSNPSIVCPSTQSYTGDCMQISEARWWKVGRECTVVGQRRRASFGSAATVPATPPVLTVHGQGQSYSTADFTSSPVQSSYTYRRFLSSVAASRGWPRKLGVPETSQGLASG